jgi:hypothetical protein
VDDEHIAILKALANRPDGVGRTVRNVSDACGLAFSYLRELLAELEESHFVDLDGPGVSATATITWSGREALKAALHGSGSITVMDGVVQIGSHNIQLVDEEDEGDDEGDDDDDDDDEEEDEED